MTYGSNISLSNKKFAIGEQKQYQYVNMRKNEASVYFDNGR